MTCPSGSSRRTGPCTSGRYVSWVRSPVATVEGPQLAAGVGGVGRHVEQGAPVRRPHRELLRDVAVVSVRRVAVPPAAGTVHRSVTPPTTRGAETRSGSRPGRRRGRATGCRAVTGARPCRSRPSPRSRRARCGRCRTRCCLPSAESQGRCRRPDASVSRRAPARQAGPTDVSVSPVGGLEAAAAMRPPPSYVAPAGDIVPRAAGWRRSGRSMVRMAWSPSRVGVSTRARPGGAAGSRRGRTGGTGRTSGAQGHADDRSGNGRRCP